MMRNADGFTLAGFIKRTKQALDQERPDIPGWHPRWDGICEDLWWFDFAPCQAVDAIAEHEGFDHD